VALIDDVLTTGATAESLAKLLRNRRGARSMCIA
jgi:predicted amidophosphoribosyltransferase